jgi:hypothetical protein
MNYLTNAVEGRVSVLNGAKFAAGTYKGGQLLGRVTASGAFTAYDAAGVDGSEMVSAVCAGDAVIPVGGGNAPVARGEYVREGVAAVMLGLAVPVTLDDVLVGQCWDAGIILN